MKILIVEGDGLAVTLTKLCGEAPDCSVFRAASLPKARRALDINRYDAIIWVPVVVDHDTIRLVMEARERYQDCSMLGITEADDFHGINALLEAGCDLTASPAMDLRSIITDLFSLTNK